jgi:hypothetical protein
MRILSKNFDESMGMADYDNAMQNASSLDIAIPSGASVAIASFAVDGCRRGPLSR